MVEVDTGTRLAATLPTVPIPPAIICVSPAAIDGDTIRCANLPASVRLIGIDAPELHGCPKARRCAPGDGQASRRALAQLLASGPVLIRRQGDGGFGRIAGRVWAGRVDVNCAMIRSGHAIRRYQRIRCPAAP
ncbi:MAG: thermonuclease family protein [Alphaproteobacteria bacterium]|nr:thermonuclease family protein [Alphaproteobacteria bacterium]